MAKPLRTRPVSGAQVRAYAAKAVEFAEAAAGADHEQVQALLAQAGANGAEVLRELRRLLPLKTRTEYEPASVAPGVAEKAVQRAQRCVAVARRVAATAR